MESKVNNIVVDSKQGKKQWQATKYSPYTDVHTCDQIPDCALIFKNFVKRRKVFRGKDSFFFKRIVISGEGREGKIRRYPSKLGLPPAK